MKSPLKVGVTGGIGSGKTTVVNFFKSLNVPAYIADKEAKRLMNQDLKLINAIKNNFGEKAYTDGSRLNNEFLAKIVFQNPNKLKQLNALVHPAVRKDFKEWIKEQNHPYIIYESALIFEHNQQNNFDFLILVTLAEQDRIKRVMKRNKIPEKEVKKRMKFQIEDNIKKDRVNYIIDNIDINKTKGEVSKINKEILRIIQ